MGIGGDNFSFLRKKKLKKYYRDNMLGFIDLVDLNGLRSFNQSYSEFYVNNIEDVKQYVTGII